MKDNVVAFAFIALMGLVIIGSWNGKFSARAEKIPVTETREYRDLVTKMENMKAEDAHQREVTFKYENEVGILVGDRDDSQRKIDELIESVGVLSDENNKLREENDTLRTTLRALSTDFEALRHRLKLCEARETGRSITHQACNMNTPENVLL
jgi:chromosome segregation ATPase